MRVNVACIRCPERIGNVGCRCALSGKPLGETVQLGCPMGRFTARCANCHGPHATASCPIPAGYVATTANATKGRCCS